MLRVDARGDACPLPVVKAKKAIAALAGAGEVEVLVDNEIAVQNLTKMAKQKGCQSTAEKLGSHSVNAMISETKIQIGLSTMQLINSLRASMYAWVCIMISSS